LVGCRRRHGRSGLHDRRDETLLDVEVARTLPPLREVLRELSEELRAGIFGLIDAMAESGELVLRRDGLRDPALHMLRSPELVEHFHRSVGRATVKRSFERAES